MLEIRALPSTDFGSHFWCVRDTGASKLIFTGFTLSAAVESRFEDGTVPLPDEEQKAAESYVIP